MSNSKYILLLVNILGHVQMVLTCDYLGTSFSTRRNSNWDLMTGTLKIPRDPTQRRKEGRGGRSDEEEGATRRKERRGGRSDEESEKMKKL